MSRARRTRVAELALATAVAAGATAGLAGCGKVVPTSDAGPPATAAQACADLANAECAKRLACSNGIEPRGVNVLHNFGTSAECVTRETLMCMNALAAPDTGNSPAQIAQCVASFASYSCADFYNADPPAPCVPKGARANGQACAFNGQCSTGLCANAKNTMCGACAALPAIGASCASSLCAHGQVCDNSTLTCKTLGDVGSACDDQSTCGYALSCVGGADASAGRTCQAAVATVGGACGGLLATCDQAQGLFCSGGVGAKTCVKVAYVGDGMSCGVLTGGGFAGCIAGGCYTATGIAGSGEMGTCKGDVLDGAPCDVALGPGCVAPARCVVTGTGTAGTCTEPSGAACG